jgi:Txe/YoeB family toxin of toxin-antitoxin system
MYKVVSSNQAVKDFERIERTGLSEKAKNITRIIRVNPYQNPPPYEKMTGDLNGYYSRRINKQHRFVYDVLPNTEKLKDKNGILYQGIVKILRMWTHYE